MPEILTESFCERCGTRYTFESAAPRTTRLKGVKVLSRGLKNFVMSDDTSLDEAMAAARSDTDREVTTQQLDAFHKTFNFCMQCRQYTCANCWNEAEGRCLTCAPHLGQDILEAPFPTLAATSDLDLRAEPNGNGNGHHHDPALEALAWPTSDLMREDDLDGPADELVASDEGIEPIDAVARMAAISGVAAAADVDAAPDVDGAPDIEAATLPVESTDAPAEPVEVAAVDVAAATIADAGTPDVAAVSPGAPAPASDASDVDLRAAAAAAATANLLRSFRPGQSLDAALEAYEREQADLAEPATPDSALPEVAAAAVVGAAAIDHADEAVPGADQGASPAATDPETGPEADHRAAAAAALAAAALAATGPAVERPSDRVEQPTWQIVAPDPVAADGAPAPVAPDAPPIAASAEPQWPAQPQWPTRTPSAGLPFLNRPATPTGGIEALWAESAREVASVPGSGPAALAPLGEVKVAGGVQPCVSCGLSLSATARFCRRCGSRQG